MAQATAPLRTIPTQTDAILSAVTSYESAQAEFNRAKKVFEEAERDLINVVGNKEEGAFTVRVNDRYKITTTGKLNRKILTDNFERIRPQMPEALLNRLVQIKETVNVRELRYIENNEPEIYKFLQVAIETKPAKTSVKVERINN